MSSSDQQQHPSPELLVAYHQQRLTVDQEDEVRAHLVACADCTTQLLELAELFDADSSSAAEEVSPSELAAAWRRQRERLFQAASVVSLEQRRAGTLSRRRPWSLAASLALAAALAVTVLAQWRTIERLKEPQTNPPLINLVPVGSFQRGSQEIAELRYSPGVERAWVILNPSEGSDVSSYGVEIHATDGRVALSLHGLQLSEAGNLRLEIPRAVLKAGNYTILLRRERGSPPQAIERFQLTVRQ